MGPFLVLQGPPFAEQVEVRQVVVRLRVLQPDGAPLLGLSLANFRLLVDGQEVPLDSAEWVDAQPAASPAPTPGANLPRQRLVLVLVQRDLQPARARGLMAFASTAAKLVRLLPAQDLVALAFEDSRLHLVQDFTRDHERVASLLQKQVFRSPPFSPADPGAPALQPRLPEEQQRAAATREKGLLLLAQALAGLPGEKVLLLLGWGLGRFSYPSFFLPADYLLALYRLQTAQVQLFSLDITQADWHTLELGLAHAAQETGGLYAKTHLFPQQALKRILGALAGYYELSFRRPPLPEGLHRLEVQLVGAKGLVLCPPSFQDPPFP